MATINLKIGAQTDHATLCE